MVSFYDRVIDVIPVNQFPKTSQMPCRKRIGDLDRTNIPAIDIFSKISALSLGLVSAGAAKKSYMVDWRKNHMENISKIACPACQNYAWSNFHIEAIAVFLGMPRDSKTEEVTKKWVEKDGHHPACKHSMFGKKDTSTKLDTSKIMTGTTNR